MDGASALLLALGAFAGASTQRVTGLGFALVSSPLFVLVVGPFHGVLLVNVLVLAVSAAVLGATWRHVDPGRTALLALPAVVLVPIGASVARHLPAPVLLMLIGGLSVTALAAVVASEHARVFRGTAGAVAAGGLSGFMTATAGIGGPAMMLYAVSTGWEHRRFVASFQLHTMILSVASISAKRGLPELSAAEFAACFAALALGVAAGQFLTRRVSADLARRAAVAVAFIGAVATVIKGVLAW